MNRGNILGWVILFVCGIFWYSFSKMAEAVPAIAGIFQAFAQGLLILGFVGLFYSYTFEGNVWIRRRFASENAGIALLIESGKFAKYFHIDLTKDSIEMEGQIYAINQAHIFYRRGSGTPYIVFSRGTVSSIDFTTVQADRDADFITRFIKQNIILWKTMAFNMMQDRLFLFMIGGLSLIAILLVLLYLGVMKPTQEQVTAIQIAISHLPTATPAPSIVPVGVTSV
jgi:hypothetical protein